MKTPLVVKIGGSLAESAALPQWLDVLENLPQKNIVIVPGGGPFAETVRTLQPLMGFDETCAHHMALLAMQQYGLAICSIHQNFTLAEDLDAIHIAWRAGKIAVWTVLPLVLQAIDLPQSWEVTSDSLALWLAQKLGAQLVLVKAMDITAKTAIIADLSAQSKIDAAFPSLFNSAPVPTYFAGPTALASARTKLHTANLFGTRLRQ